MVSSKEEYNIKETNYEKLTEYQLTKYGLTKYAFKKEFESLWPYSREGGSD